MKSLKPTNRFEKELDRAFKRALHTSADTFLMLRARNARPYRMMFTNDNKSNLLQCFRVIRILKRFT
jgi:hypothetical protein